MEQHLRGEYQASASNGRLYSFVNAMHSAGICCRKQQCQGNVYRFRFYAKHCKTVQQLAQEYGVQLELMPRRTLQKFLFQNRFRFGVPLGILLSAALLFYGSNIVMEIDVTGSDTVSVTEVTSILETCGVRRGTWIPDIDFAQCEHTLRAEVDELAWVGIRHTGTRLVVEVMERTPEPEMQLTRQPSNIIAAQDGHIVSVSVYRGQLMKLVGDPVQKGDLLVSGLYTDETGHTGIRHAMGSIIGEYQQTEKFSCSYAQTLRRPTGETNTQKYLDLFTWHIPLSSTDVPYADSIRTSGYHWFSLFGKELPIGIYQETFHEYRTRTFSLTPAEAAQNAEEQIERYEDNFLSNVEILDKKTTALETESGVEYTVTYTLQGEIGVQQELYLH